ncbi:MULTISPECIES: 3'-5' exonuclease [Clostridium]|jgi:DNA polymerase III epsilon subunit-like protein|uniref:Exonuclease family protein n=2 Tax=root TaxID=1 RepID=R9C2F4_9CLOT|nr:MULTISPECIES: 3'-5' exonuclease [Clostridium]EOR21391.1 exonuclease family protein [Clostridium sartagoforme AAU1]KLE16963.1 exonuclease [Clostridium sp. C8]
MAFIIIDLEFNNLEGIHKYYSNIFDEYPNLKNAELDNEVIEIGAIKLDNYMKPLEEFKTYIKPVAIPILNPKISEITNITIEDIEKGISFKEGIERLAMMIEDDDIICSWAKDDIIEIINNAMYHNYDNLKWLKNYLDLQEYSTKILAKKKSLSLKNALEELKIKIDNNKLHDALNDAVYTSLVFKRIYNSRAVKNYIIKDIYNMPAMDIKNLEEYKLDIKKLNEKCPKCNINLDIEYNFTPVKWRFISLGKCPKCNNKVMNELIVKKTFSGEEVYNEISTIIDEIEYINYGYKIKKIYDRLIKY